MGLGQGGSLLVQTARLLHDGCGLAKQDRIACDAEDKIGPPSVRDHVDHLWGCEMAVAADQDMRPWPVVPQVGQEPGQDHCVLRARGPRAWPEAGGHQGV